MVSINVNITGNDCYTSVADELESIPKYFISDKYQG